MQCFTPVYVRSQQTFVPCGQCAYCLNKRINGWVVRIKEEMSQSSSAFFLTLTYDTPNLPSIGMYDSVLSKRDLQLWLKRLRKLNSGIRYFAVGEYGGQFGRPHYHVLLFNLLDLSLVTKTWTAGFIQGDRLTDGRIRYALAYCLGVRNSKYAIKPFALMSRNPGIGHTYVDRMKDFHRARSDSCVYDFDCANAMPRYFVDKIWDTPGQRRYLHMQRIAYTLRHPPPEPCPIHHDNLMKKLNRKNL